MTDAMQNPAGPPLDYSFLEIKSVADLPGEDPRSGTVRQKSEAAEPPPEDKKLKEKEKDAPPSEAASPTKRAKEVARQSVCCSVEDSDGVKSSTAEVRAIRLNNNLLCDIKGLHEVAGELVDKPDDVAWVDVSFNNLTKIED